MTARTASDPGTTREAEATEWHARVPRSEMDAWGDLGGCHAMAVLMVLRLHAGEDGHARPSIETISEVARVGTTKVKAILKAAKEAGYIEVESRHDANRRGRPSNVYRLKVASRPKSPDDPGLKVASRPETPNFGRRGVGILVAGRLGTDSPRNRTREKNPPNPPRVGGGLGEVNEVWTHYLEEHRRHHVRRNGRPPTEPRLNATRRDLIRARLRDYPLDDLKRAITGLFRSPFHCGENDRGTSYLSLEIALRVNRETNNIEKFRDAWPAGPSAGGVGSRYNPIKPPTIEVDEDDEDAWRSKCGAAGGAS